MVEEIAQLGPLFVFGGFPKNSFLGYFMTIYHVAKAIANGRMDSYGLWSP
jgi:hypothetical protein